MYNIRNTLDETHRNNKHYNHVIIDGRYQVKR